MRTRSLARASLVAALLLGLLAAAIIPTLSPAQAAPPRQVLTHIVISQFRTNGPNGADDDFIELFNPTQGPISMNGWSLRRSGDCSPLTYPIYPLGNVSLLPGQHYLIGGLTYAGPADASSVNIGVGDKGGIALLDNNQQIVDAVGMCNITNYVESPELQPLLGDLDQSYERLPGGSQGSCVDTGHNASDFVSISPSAPHTFNDPLTPCIYPTATPTDTPTDTATGTTTSTATSTPTPSNTPTASITPPVSCALTPTPSTAYPALSVVINEVAWSGTVSSSNDQWIELYNPGPCPINLNNWTLQAWYYSIQNILFTIQFDNTDVINGGEYIVLAQNTNVFSANVPDYLVASNIDLHYTYGESLHLFGPHQETVDTANSLSGRWPAGNTTYRQSMERLSSRAPDIAANWVTWAGSTTKLPSSPLDHYGYVVRGTPGMANWATTVTLTPSPVPSRYKTSTPRPPTPFGHMVINEFLPRSGSDWNGDGAVNVYDEFIELKNLGPVPADLKGWKLDVLAAGISTSYTLPSQKMNDGDRLVFYGSQTDLLLVDSGATVRLFNARGVLIDARSYGPVASPDISHCRIPDGYYWKDACFPTPGNENSLTGVAPAAPPKANLQPPPCLLADTVPQPFRDAECSPTGADIFNPAYWNDPAGHSQFPVPDRLSKWKTWVE